MSTRRRLGRVGAAVAGVGALAGWRAHRAYEADLRAAYAAIEAADTETLETPTGTVEYQTRGAGPPVLVSHGIVGGFDQAVQTGESLFDGDARVIGVSRFGYLGSDLPTDPSPDAQASAFAAVLDDCGVEEAAVVGTSAGGAPAIRFALDYPDRTRALVLIGSNAPSAGPLRGPTGPPRVLLRDPVFWGLVTYAPWAVLLLFGVDLPDYAAAAPAERQRVRNLLETLVPVEPRRPGIRTDARVTNTAMVEHADDYPVERITAPTLVVHAADDPLASYDDAVALAGRVPDATLLDYETGGHLVFGHGEEIRRTVTAFVSSPGAVPTVEF